MAKKTSAATKVEMGVAGLAALAAAAAGAFYFYGSKDAAKNRKHMKAWMVQAKGEVMERMENLKDFSRESYDMAVVEVMNKYAKLKKVEPAELAALAKELKGYWNNIPKHVNELGKTKKALPKKAKSRKAKQK